MRSPAMSGSAPLPPPAFFALPNPSPKFVLLAKKAAATSVGCPPPAGSPAPTLNPPPQLPNGLFSVGADQVAATDWPARQLLNPYGLVPKETASGPPRGYRCVDVCPPAEPVTRTVSAFSANPRFTSSVPAAYIPPISRAPGPSVRPPAASKPVAPPPASKPVAPPAVLVAARLTRAAAAAAGMLPSSAMI